MIRAYTGLPGGGKSYAATVDAIDELKNGFRTVFHNMEMNHGEMAAYLKDRGYEPDCAVMIRKIPEERVRDFWEYAKEQGVLSARLFLIDEAHVYFDSRAWAEIGPTMSRYLTQHRHLNDELLFVTQHLEMLDKRIRLLIAQTTQFRNLKTERWLQWFRPPEWMLWSEFYGVPKYGQKPQAIGKRKLDMAIAACYKTSVGHGGMGASGVPESQRKTKRFNWWWLAIPAAALLYLVANGPEILLRWGVGSAMEGLGAKPSVVSPESIPANTTKPQPVDPGQPHKSAVTTAATKEPSPAPRVRGYVADSNGMRILLDDGRTLTEEDRPYRRAGRIYWSTGESAIWTR